jgi:hypothetical protein
MQDVRAKLMSQRAQRRATPGRHQPLAHAAATVDTRKDCQCRDASPTPQRR